MCPLPFHVKRSAEIVPASMLAQIDSAMVKPATTSLAVIDLNFAYLPATLTAEALKMPKWQSAVAR